MTLTMKQAMFYVAAVALGVAVVGLVMSLATVVL